ncbi:MAG TPA: alpha/beta hydrolase fold domain-containing protein [Solirubrobacteraceae bacterium]
MTGSRIADLTLRGTEGRMRARVSWPASAGPGASAALVFFPQGWFHGAGGDVAELVCAGLCTTASIVLVLVHWRRSTGYDAAVRDATSAIGWIADHAADLDADPQRLFVGGEGDAAPVVAEVVREARHSGWPAIAGELYTPAAHGGRSRI